MNTYEIVDAIRQLTNQKNVTREIVLETLQTALVAAAKKNINASKTLDIESEVDDRTGELRVYAYKQVVDEVTRPTHEIALVDALKIDPQVELGDEVQVDLNLADFGRNAIQLAKQVLIQRIRESERDRIYEEYKDQTGVILTGTVRQIDRGNIIVALDRTEAVIPPSEQIPKDRFHIGDTIRALLIEVDRNSKGAQLTLSRTANDFLKRLFELEVPEIQQKIVEIKAVARDPGERAKIAVRSSERRVDPVGACVGIRGSRVQAVVRELNNERIDIVPWSEDPAVFVSRALAPARINRIIIYEREHRMEIVVEKDQLSLAIGKNGQNVRLAHQLTGWSIDLLTVDEYDTQLEREDLLEICDDIGADRDIIDLLAAEGFATVQSVAGMSLARLIEITNLPEDMAAALLRETQALIEEDQPEETGDTEDELIDGFEDDDFDLSEPETDEPEDDNPPDEPAEEDSSEANEDETETTVPVEEIEERETDAPGSPEHDDDESK